MEGWPAAELFLDLHQPSVPLAEAAGRRLAASSGDRLILDFYKSRHLLRQEGGAHGAPGGHARPALGHRGLLRPGASALCWAGTASSPGSSTAPPALARPARTSGAVAKGQGARRRVVSGQASPTNPPPCYLVAQGMDAIWTDDLAMWPGAPLVETRLLRTPNWPKGLSGSFRARETWSTLPFPSETCPRRCRLGPRTRGTLLYHSRCQTGVDAHRHPRFRRAGGRRAGPRRRARSPRSDGSLEERPGSTRASSVMALSARLMPTV